MSVLFPAVSYKTNIRTTTQELSLALAFARREYAAACDRQAEAWRLYEEALDDGDREAIRDLTRATETFDMLQADAYQDREAAYAAYFAAVS